jgi:GNAT superfamily N-acetyltransferase
MQHFGIRRPSVLDKEELSQFFREVITDTFAREGLAHLLHDIENEIKNKNAYLKRDLDTNGEDRYFLIAVLDEKIIGTIEYGPPSEIINFNSNESFRELVEVGTVYVHPDYQRQGVGNQLLNEMIQILQNRGLKEFCLDSGYSNAQQIWKKKFGEPDILLKDYWGSGSDHMIWKIRLL